MPGIGFPAFFSSPLCMLVPQPDFSIGAPANALRPLLPLRNGNQTDKLSSPLIFLVRMLVFLILAR